jgi:2-hydroxychromene-2-carboxylate isomerase
MTKKIDYYMAPHSPWSYLGHARLVAMAKKYNATIHLKPADLVKVFSVSGGVPVSQRPPQRQAYRLAELQRWSKFLNIPMTLHPKFFPISGEPGAKLIIAALQVHGTDKALELAHALGHAVWEDEKNITDEPTLIAIADHLGLHGAELLKQSTGDAVAAEFAKNTEEAIAANVFGAPWYSVDGEGYWGQDRLEFVERALMGK